MGSHEEISMENLILTTKMVIFHPKDGWLHEKMMLKCWENDFRWISLKKSRFFMIFHWFFGFFHFSWKKWTKTRMVFWTRLCHHLRRSWWKMRFLFHRKSIFMYIFHQKTPRDHQKSLRNIRKKFHTLLQLPKKPGFP